MVIFSIFLEKKWRCKNAKRTRYCLHEQLSCVNT